MSYGEKEVIDTLTVRQSLSSRFNCADWQPAFPMREAFAAIVLCCDTKSRGGMCQFLVKGAANVTGRTMNRSAIDLCHVSPQKLGSFNRRCITCVPDSLPMAFDIYAGNSST